MEQNERYTVEFTGMALNDITEIVSSFIMLGSKNGAIRIKERINKASEQITQFPFSGISVPDEKLSKLGYRMIIVEKYLMFYRIFENKHNIVFYRVLNGKRDYPALMNRLNQENE